MKNIKKDELKKFYIPYRKTLDLPRDVTFGLEIEFKIDGFNNSYKADFIDEDNAALSFLDEKGYDYNYEIQSEINNHIELISPVLTDKHKTWQELYDILLFIKNNGGYYSGVCGAHVHVGKNILNPDNDSWLNFFKIWYVFEDYITTFTNGENYMLRQNGKKRACSINTICQQIIREYLENKYINFSLLTNDKRNSINFPYKNLFCTPEEILKRVEKPRENNKCKTIEFRSPNGTINPVIWQNNINFFTKFMLSCKNKNLDTEKLEYLYNNKSNANEYDLCDLIFSNEFDKMCFLRQYYKDFDNLYSKTQTSKSTPFWK